MNNMYKTDELKSILTSNGIKASHQRLKIYEYLINTDSHPTVEDIYNNLKNEISTLSKTTIYNTLNYFAKHGIISIITIEEKENRYDANVSRHGHFKCESCGKVYDFPLNECNLFKKNFENFKIKYRHVYFGGICSKCNT